MSPPRHLDLPLLPTPLIGRDALVAEARGQLTSDGGRLLTLTGPPGVGKTSLALTVAHDLSNEFRYGARLVDLAPVEDPARVLVAIADGLGMRRSGEREPVEQIVRFIRDRRLLLMLDNFEQVVEAASVVADLLVTSRVPLRIRWERELPVGPLPVPGPESAGGVAALESIPSVALFVARARAVSQRFRLSSENAEFVGEICVALDGLPLAIELAAARIRTLSAAEIAASLAGSGASGASPAWRVAPLDLLADGPRDLPPRQQSLRRAVSWSYDLLEPVEQELLRRLAVFAGGCTFEAAATVCGGSWETITTLVAHSLVRYDETSVSHLSRHRPPDPRIRLLETVRQFGIERLIASGEWQALRQRHAAFFLDLAEQAEPELAGPRQVAWLDRLSEDRDNLRAAARWATESGDAETVIRLGSALIRFWRLRGDAADARDRVEAVRALASMRPPLPGAGRAFAGAADLARILGDFASAEALYQSSLDAAQSLGNQHGAAVALCELCRLACARGRYDHARGYGDGSLALFETLGDLAGQATALRERGMVSYFQGDQIRARDDLERALALGQHLRDQRLIADIAFSLAVTYHVCRQLDAAWPLYQQALTIDRSLGHRAGIGSVLNNLGNVATLQGDLVAARSLFAESLRASGEVGDGRRQALTLSAVAGLAAVMGEPERALRLDAVGVATVEALGTKLGAAMRVIYDALLAPAREALGEPGAMVARVSGRITSLDEAVAEAVAWLAVGEEPADADAEDRPDGSAHDAIVDAWSSPSDRVAPTSVAALTRRERDVAILLARGQTTNREIAAALVISEGTAANYVQRVLNRLELRTRAQVAAWAAEHHLHEGPPGA